MRIHGESRTLFLEPEDTDKSGPCPVCGLIYKPNGTGPANSPRTARALKYLPSEHYLGGFPPTFHDWAFLICREGWVVHATYGNLSVTAFDFDSANIGYNRLMHAKVRRTAPFGTQWIWHSMADRNEAFVAGLGDSSFRHEH